MSDKKLTDRLKKEVSTLIRAVDQNSITEIGKSLNNTIQNIYIEVDREKFITLLKLLFINPLKDFFTANKLSQAGSISMLSKRSSTIIKTRNTTNDTIDSHITKENIVDDIFVNYMNELIEDDFVSDWLSNKRDQLINVRDENKQLLRAYPNNDYKTYLISCLSFVKEYFKKRSSYPNKDEYQTEIYLFIDDCNEAIDFLKGELTESKKRVDEAKKEIEKPSKTNTITLSDGSKHFINTHETLKSCIKNNEKGILNLNLHIDKIKVIEDYLYSNHTILKDKEAIVKLPKTVFGHTNLDETYNFYRELEFFLEDSTRDTDINRIFSTEEGKNIEKVNLVNGTLNDYGHLINEMNCYFLEEYGNKKVYNQWWADRFTFNDANKGKKAISTIRSNARKDISREAQYKTKIASIIDQLGEIPH